MRILAEKKGKTDRGNYFSIIQDTPTSFHISVSVGDTTQYEHMENPASLDILDLKVLEMENGLCSVPKLSQTS
jgi:hypothetical protein